MKANQQYSIADAEGMAVKISVYQRRKMFQLFLSSFNPKENHTILDVGVTGDRSFASSNYLEAWHEHKQSITALGLDDASFLEKQYPGVKFVQGNGLSLPFKDNSFDFVHCAAVLEHVGSSQNQELLISEAARVARHGFFMTTPNRWFPIEFHTVLPLLHWLPKKSYRILMEWLGYSFFASESNLNLVGSGELKLQVSNALGDNRIDFSVSNVRLWGWASNIILIGKKSSDC